MQHPGQRGSFFSPAVARLFGESLEPEALELIRHAATATDRQYLDAGGGMTHGLRIFRLALGLGLGGDIARGCGVAVDALQIAVDMADNLADEALDRAQGRSYAHLYEPIPADCRPALPALMLGAVITALFCRFPAPGYDAGRAAQRLVAVLGRMVVGQGFGRADPRRIDGISGEQGRLYALPLWLGSDRSEAQEARLAAVERWGFEFGRTWQLRREVLEAPEEPHWVEELARAEDRALGAWPDFAPFTGRGLYAPAMMGIGGRHG